MSLTAWRGTTAGEGTAKSVIEASPSSLTSSGQLHIPAQHVGQAHLVDGAAVDGEELGAGDHDAEGLGS